MLSRTPFGRLSLSRSSRESGLLNESESPWGLKELSPGQQPILDVVAVHGLNGHRERSWTAGNGVLWLRDLLPAQLPHARILTYGYDIRTHAFDELSYQSINGHGTTLLTSLCLFREKTKTTQRPIIFIAHSLGGLVLKSALIHSNLATKSHNEKHKAFKLSTYGILFCGTPHQGGNGISWAKLAMGIMSIYAKTNSHTLSQLEVHSTWLNDQLEHFKSISSDFDTVFIYEGYATSLLGGASIMVVPPWSAIVPGAINADSVEIRKNHRTMIQFNSANDNDFITITTYLSVMSEKAPPIIQNNWGEWQNTKSQPNPRELTKKSVDILSSLLTDPANYQVDFALPFRKNKFFIGRQDIVKRLDSILSEYTAVLYGIGGIGKTQVAQHYVYMKNVDISAVLWLNATSLESLQESFLRIAQELVDHYVRLVSSTQPPYGRVAEILGLKGMVDETGRVKKNIHEPDSIVHAVLSWLNVQSNQGWLAVYDNYDDPESFAIGKFMPSLHTGRIIVTSRRRECARLGKGIEVGSLSVQEGVELLLQSCQLFSAISEEEKAEATRIVEKLECLPLAIDHAGGYIFTKMISLKEYLPLFGRNARTVLNRSLPTFGLEQDHDPIFMTWDTSFTAIKKADPIAITILTYCSFYANGDIPTNVFADMIGINVDTHVAILYSYSFVKRGSSDSIMIHPLVHTWARERLDVEAKTRECEAAFRMIVNAARIPEDNHSRMTEQWALERRLLLHIDIALKWVLTLHALEELSDRNSALWTDCAYIYTVHKRYSDAESLYNRVLESKKRAFGENTLETARTKLGLARLYRLQGRNEEASEFFEQCNPFFEKDLGPSSLESCQTLRGLAVCRKEQSRFHDAIDLLERAITGYDHLLGPQHPETLVALESLALIHERLGQHDEALDSIDRVLASNTEKLGPEHPNTLRNMSNKATILSELGRHEESKALLKQAFRSAEVQFGPLDQFTLKTIHNLAYSSFRQEQYGEAEPLCELAITGWEKTKGKSHILTIGSIELLGVVYQKQGLHDKAISCLETALAGYSALSGPSGSISVYRTLDYLAQVYVSREEPLTAKGLYKDALRGYKELLGPQNKTTLRIAADFAAFCAVQGWEEDTASILS
ncbi:hypothetical protein V8E51_009916 [Hyaloscypha variabilis]